MKNDQLVTNVTRAKAISLILIASIGSSMIYSLASLRKVYYTSLVSGLNITNEQLGYLVSLWSLICMISYIPGGIIGDKVRMKYLATTAFIANALVIFWHATMPSYEVLRFVYIAYGISSGLIFWACRYKIIKLVSVDEKDYSRNIGWSYSAFALAGIVLSYAFGWIFQQFSEQTGLVISMYLCGVFNVIMGILSFIFIPKFKNELTVNTTNTFSLSNFIDAIKHPGVILSSLSMFFLYTIYTLQYTTTAYLEKGFLASAVLVATMGTMRTFGVNLIASPTLGSLAKKFSPSKVLIGSLGILSFLFLAMIFIPHKQSLTIMVAILIVITGFLMNGSYGIASAQMPECKVPDNIFATAAGIYSFVGFAPDVIFHPIVGRWMDNYGNDAFNYIFILCIACCILVMLVSLIILKYVKHLKAKETA